MSRKNHVWNDMLFPIMEGWPVRHLNLLSRITW